MIELKSTSFYERILSPLALTSLMLYLLGLFFPVRVAQSIGFAGILIAALLALSGASFERRNIPWLFACGLMFVAGWWGTQVASDGGESWRFFWSYQMIGKGVLCALALLFLPMSTRQLGWLLVFLLAMLAARNVQLLAYALQNTEVLRGMPTSESQLLGFRNQADHILLLAPFVLAITLSWRRWYVSATFVIASEVFLLALTGWRGAWLGLFGGFFVLLFHFRAWKVLGFLLLLPVLIGIAGMLAVDSNIVGQAIQRGFSDSQRVELVWKPVFALLAASGWQGYGFGSARFMEVFAGYVAAHPGQGLLLFPDAHNMVLAFAMAAGWLGACAFIAILSAAVCRCISQLRLGTTPEKHALLAGILAAWIGLYALLGMTDQPFYNNLAVLAALTSVAFASERKRAQ